MGNRTLTAEMSQQTLDAVAEAGELLIRAASVLGRLTAEELDAVSKATDGKLTECIAWALEGAAALSPQTRESLSTHPPVGCDVRVRSGVYIGFKGVPR